MSVAFPGGTSVSELEVYSGVAPDGLAGGTPHLHVASSEAYVVVGGRGRLQTVDASGFAERALEPGSVVWFSPGVVHRAVNDGGLAVRVIMQNAGLPEAGDAVMTFADDVLADAEAYRAAATLPGSEGSDADRLAAALRRRDAAVAGFLDLRRAAEAGDPEPLARLHRRAAALVAPRADAWTAIWHERIVADVERTRARLASLAAGDAEAVAAALADGRVAAGAPEPAFGMCGMLRRFPAAADPTPTREDPS
ncbi:cupin domain-containing protein [Agromyces sp. MMS24-K17]|uniref:cupin domain-containing protein n=1 Tax=Agromyces sp. MMS24-K17 TaxID=3372850 RepID=UPI003754042F